MDIIISNSSTSPIYEQISRQIKDQIWQGELKAGDALPPCGLLAKELRISLITTKRAYEDLEKDGFLETVPGKGCSSRRKIWNSSGKSSSGRWKPVCRSGERRHPLRLGLEELKEMLEGPLGGIAPPKAAAPMPGGDGGKDEPVWIPFSAYKT